jgi:hypothetical protein
MFGTFVPSNQLNATLPPPVMHTCRESRRYAKYEKATLSPSSPKYIWVNFDNDVLCVDFQDFIDRRELKLLRSQICRLRITVDYVTCYDLMYFHVHKWLKDFSSLDELHLFIVDGGMVPWVSVFEDREEGFFPAQNVRYIDSASGLILNGQQLKMSFDWRLFHASSHSSEDNYAGLTPQTLEQALISSLRAGYMKLWQMHQVE